MAWRGVAWRVVSSDRTVPRNQSVTERLRALPRSVQTRTSRDRQHRTSPHSSESGRAVRHRPSLSFIEGWALAVQRRPGISAYAAAAAPGSGTTFCRLHDLLPLTARPIIRRPRLGRRALVRCSANGHSRDALQPVVAIDFLGAASILCGQLLQPCRRCCQLKERRSVL